MYSFLIKGGFFPAERAVTSACFSSASLPRRLLAAAWWSISIKHWVRQRWQHHRHNPVSSHLDSAKRIMTFQWPSIPSLSPQPVLHCKDSLSENSLHLSNAKNIKTKQKKKKNLSCLSPLPSILHLKCWGICGLSNLFYWLPRTSVEAQ